jgi:hypothetical protein
MGSFRTIFLLLLAAFCGIGAGVFAAVDDGLYPAFLLIAFPFVVAFLFFSIVRDVLRESRQLAESSGVGKDSRQAGPEGLDQAARNPRAA